MPTDGKRWRNCSNAGRAAARPSTTAPAGRVDASSNDAGRHHLSAGGVHFAEQRDAPAPRGSGRARVERAVPNVDQKAREKKARRDSAAAPTPIRAARREY